MRFGLIIPVALLLAAADAPPPAAPLPAAPPAPPHSAPITPEDMILVKRQVIIDAANDMDKPSERRDGFISRALNLVQIANNTPAYHVPAPPAVADASPPAKP